jgi:hypothetical protein
MTFSIPAVGSEQSSFNTILAGGDLPDMFVPYIGGAANLYKENYVMDITDYVNKYMPNYLAWLNEAGHENVKTDAYVTVDGVKKILEVYGVSDGSTPWCGYEYRRDWILKYGKNPKTGAAFTGGYDANGNWTDDIVFPNGSDEPIYISDWEWMLGIFKTAITTENRSNGYCMTLYYPGYLETGDLVTSFGGGGPIWYKHDGTVTFGATSDNFRTYVQTMNTWYKNGWIDTHFAERTSDMFYLTDTTNVMGGNVGLWYGPSAYLGNGLTSSVPDSCVSYAMEPINDKYGPDSAKNKEPYAFFQAGNEGLTVSFNSKCIENHKNLPAMFSLLDYQYSDEGAYLNALGLNKEQYEECKDPLYTKKGLTNGAYIWVDSTGADWVEGTSTGDKLYKIDPKLIADSDLRGDVIGQRVIGRAWGTSNKYWTESPIYVKAMKAWTKYTDSHWFSAAMTNSETSDDAALYSTARDNVNTFLAKNVPTMINNTRDPNSDTVWKGFVNSLGKYKVTEVTAMFQKLVDAFK